MKDKRVVVVGARGRLGAALVRRLADGYDVTGLGREVLDLNTPDAMADSLRNLDFDCMINCAALTNVDYCETHEAEAWRVNADAARSLAVVCRDKVARLIHISTDYVFDGKEPGLRKETDDARPISVYGRSKKAGEEGVLEVDGSFLCARVSWVFGPDRASFIDSIAQRACSEESVEAISDKWSSPTYTEDLSNWLEVLMFSYPVGGVMHLCNAGETTWREYGEFALDCLAEAGVALKARKVNGVDMGFMRNFIAQRPVHTAMDTGRFTEVTGIRPRHWQEAVREYVETVLAERLR